MSGSDQNGFKYGIYGLCHPETDMVQLVGLILPIHVGCLEEKGMDYSLRPALVNIFVINEELI